MYPVYLNKEGLVFEEFKENLISICRRHQLENRASAFAFIIYDFENPQLHKILFDDAYWNSLNLISGKYLTIFSLFENPTKRSLLEKSAQWTSTMSFEAHKIETDKSIEISYKEIINTFFGGTEFKTPSILFFQVNNDVITKHFVIELKEEKVEEGFLEIKKIIKLSIDAVKDISEENRENYNEIFDMIQVNVKASTWWKTAKKVTAKAVGIAWKLKIFLSLLKGF